MRQKCKTKEKEHQPHSCCGRSGQGRVHSTDGNKGILEPNGSPHPRSTISRLFRPCAIRSRGLDKGVGVRARFYAGKQTNEAGMSNASSPEKQQPANFSLASGVRTPNLAAICRCKHGFEVICFFIRYLPPFAWKKVSANPSVSGYCCIYDIHVLPTCGGYEWRRWGHPVAAGT